MVTARPAKSNLGEDIVHVSFHVHGVHAQERNTEKDTEFTGPNTEREKEPTEAAATAEAGKIDARHSNVND